ELKLPSYVKKDVLAARGIPYVQTTDLEGAMPQLDILYMTRVQRERFSDPREYEQVKNVYCLRRSMLENAKPNLRVLHPLPRVNEIAYDVDDSDKAYYFQQAQNGLYARQAIICRMLNIPV
ncbi:MAG: aspartate carbamoyltransferase, partial [Bacteroidales bacterium]|nr:aspartate carbamoyltransferase [Bacteroidales bacterium]